MNQIKQLGVILTRVLYDQDGKASSLLLSKLLVSTLTLSKLLKLKQLIKEEKEMMSQTLELIFNDAVNKTIKLQIPKIEHSVNEGTVKEGMNKLITLDILRPKTGIPTKVHSAHIIDKTTNVLFEN